MEKSRKITDIIASPSSPNYGLEEMMKSLKRPGIFGPPRPGDILPNLDAYGANDTARPATTAARDGSE
jgi:hypothetical protein